MIQQQILYKNISLNYQTLKTQTKGIMQSEQLPDLDISNQSEQHTSRQVVDQGDKLQQEYNNDNQSSLQLGKVNKNILVTQNKQNSSNTLLHRQNQSTNSFKWIIIFVAILILIYFTYYFISDQINKTQTGNHIKNNKFIHKKNNQNTNIIDTQSTQSNQENDKTNTNQDQLLEDDNPNDFIDTQPWFDIVRLNSTSALCLDGSPAAYYISKNGDPSKIFIQFEGGGWCGAQSLNSTLLDCYYRTFSEQGSSKMLPNQLIMNQGVLSTNVNNNFKTWKRIYFPYCDGSGHQGSRKEPIMYQERQLYFRGHNITVQRFQSIQSLIGLYSKASKVVISGYSAGALAVFYWTNYLVQRVKHGKVFALPDSGVFLNQKSMRTRNYSFKQTMKNIMSLSNVQIDPPTAQCVNQHPNQKQLCLFAQNLIKYIKAPIFVIQSLYDSWYLANVLGIYCFQFGYQNINNCPTEEKREISKYLQRLKIFLSQLGQKKQNGYWISSYAKHGFTRFEKYLDKDFTVPQRNGSSAHESVQKWLRKRHGQNHKYIDQV